MRRAKYVTCECEFPDCSGLVPPTTAQRHLEYTLAQQVIQKIEVLIAGYPPPHVLWPGWQLDDESDALTRRSPDDPPDFELAEEDADMEDGPMTLLTAPGPALE